MTDEEIEEAVRQAIAACDDDARAAVRALVLANLYLEAEVERLAEAVSRGYARGRLPSPAEARRGSAGD